MVQVKGLFFFFSSSLPIPKKKKTKKSTSLEGHATSPISGVKMSGYRMFVKGTVGYVKFTLACKVGPTASMDGIISHETCAFTVA